MNTILVIEDNKTYRQNLIEVFELENYATLEAENGLIGLHMIQRHLPDIILCDIDMPVMNGIEVLRHVKADPFFAKIPFIISTGSSDGFDLKTAQELGAASYLTKPAKITDVLETIVYLLENRKTIVS